MSVLRIRAIDSVKMRMATVGSQRFRSHVLPSRRRERHSGPWSWLETFPIAIHIHAIGCCDDAILILSKRPGVVL